MAGRPPKPTLIHKIEGTGRNHRLKHRANEVRPSVAVLDYPPWMSEEAVNEWNRLTTNSGYAKALNATHRAWMIVHCELWADFVEWRRDCPKEPFSSERLKTMASFMMKLGLNPSDAVKVHAPMEDKPEDPWAKLG